KYSGPSVIISFVITGVIVFLSSLSFSELGAMMPSSGSVYTYIYAALGGIQSKSILIKDSFFLIHCRIFGVVYWMEFCATLSIRRFHSDSTIVQAPVAWDEDDGHFFVTGQVINLPAIAITIAITILLIIRVHQMARVNLVLVVFKIITLLIFIFACCNYVNRNNYNPFFPPNQGSFSEYGITGMLKACTFVFFASVDFESVSTVAQEAKSPERSLPIAIIGTTIISSLLYVGVCTVMIGLVPYNLLDTDSPLAEAIKATPYGLWLSIIMNLGAITSCTTVVLTMMLSQTRIFYAMAHDGVFCAVFSGIFPVDILGETTSIGALITYIFVHITVIVMRYTHGDMQRVFQVPFGSWLVPIVGSLLCILLMKGISKATGFRFLVWTALGQIIYFSYGFWHSKRRKLIRNKSNLIRIELLPTVSSVLEQYTQNELESNLTNEHTGNAV
ncbi:unnamed protein product, partial [Rotaria sordida]